MQACRLCRWWGSKHEPLSDKRECERALELDSLVSVRSYDDVCNEMYTNPEFYCSQFQSAGIRPADGVEATCLTGYKN